MGNEKHLYILVADSGRARVFRAVTPINSLESVFDQVHFESRKKPSEVFSDRAGSQRTDRGGYHSFAGERKTGEDVQFSRELCQFLCEEHRKGHYSQLILIAPPRFLGELRKHLEKECGEVLLQTIAKDLVKLNENDIIERVLKAIPELNRPAM